MVASRRAALRSGLVLLVVDGRDVDVSERGPVCASHGLHEGGEGASQRLVSGCVGTSGPVSRVDAPGDLARHQEVAVPPHLRDEARDGECLLGRDAEVGQRTVVGEAAVLQDRGWTTDLFEVGPPARDGVASRPLARRKRRQRNGRRRGEVKARGTVVFVKSPSR